MRETGMQDDQTRIRDAQRELFSHQWDEVSWDGQPLYPIQLPLEEILRGSPIPLHRPYPATRLNAVGTPRCGTKWLQRILTLLTVPQREPSFLEKVCKPILDRTRRIAHFHEGIIEDYKPSQKIVFIYRDVRDAVVSGYVYIKTGQHPGMMNCTTELHQARSQDEGLRAQLVMYMKYRMPVLNYWYHLDAPNVVKVRYEDLLRNLDGEIRRINREAQLGADEETLSRTIAQSSFRSMTGGRTQGQEDRQSHQRKGIQGDWRNWFNDDLRQTFREMGGEDFVGVLR